jgi:hypothetical protein
MNRDDFYSILRRRQDRETNWRLVQRARTEQPAFDPVAAMPKDRAPSAISEPTLQPPTEG